MPYHAGYENRYRYVKTEISYEFFTDLFAHGREHHFKITDGLPEDTKVYRAYTDGHLNRVTLVLEHESFEPIAGTIPATRSWNLDDLPTVHIEVTTIDQ